MTCASLCPQSRLTKRLLARYLKGSLGCANTLRGPFSFPSCAIYNVTPQNPQAPTPVFCCGAASIVAILLVTTEAAMNDTITRQLEAELATLRAQLEELDIVKDIQALERIIRRMRGEGSRSPSSSTPDKPASHGRQEASTSVVMKDAAEDFLSGQTGPVQTKEIWDALAAQGIHVPGDNPQNNLSAHMSRDPRFVSLGREGWVLAARVPSDDSRAKAAGDSFATSLPATKIDEINKLLNETDDIPAEMDRALLGFARSELGRNLMESEKRALRSGFKEAMQLRSLIG